MQSNLLDSIKEHEGYSKYAYKDSLGYLTIGFGRCIDKIKGKGLTLSEALILLQNDIYECSRQLEPFVFYQQLDSVRKDVLVEMCFNMGIDSLLEFKNMINNLKNKNFQGASTEMRSSKWATQIGKERLYDLCYRMLYGRYQS